jgi:murein DD-endopeptidase MepM/ murein hydrolase activator NlpD
VGHTGQNTSTTDHLHYQISNPQSSVASSGDWRNPEVVLANWPNY